MKSIPRHIKQGLTQRGSKTVLTQGRVKERKPANIKLVQNTVHNYRKRWGHVATALMNLRSLKPFLKAAQVNEEQWELMPHINTYCRFMMYYNS